MLLRGGATAHDAVDVVRGLRAADAHRFWLYEFGYDGSDMRGVGGYKQVTDAYLAGLARLRGGRLARLDRTLAALHADIALLRDGEESSLTGSERCRHHGGGLRRSRA